MTTDRLVEAAYNDIKFDCRERFHPTINGDCSQCMVETEKIRQDLMPWMMEMLERHQSDRLSDCETYIGSVADVHEYLYYLRLYIANTICQAYSESYAYPIIKILHPCLSENEDYLDAFLNHIHNFTDTLLKTFDIPNCLLGTTLNNLHNGCTWFGDVASCYNAMMRMPNDEVCYSVSMLNMVEGFINERPYYAGIPLKRAEQLFKNTSSIVDKVLLMLLNSENDENEDDCMTMTECREGLSVTDSYNNLVKMYKMLKQIIAPSSMYVHEKSEQADMIKVREIISTNFPYYLNNDTLINEYGPIIACNFVHMTNYTWDRECDLFSNIFTTSGIGYSFNHENFWSLYKNTTGNSAFYKEMHEKDKRTDSVLPIARVGLYNSFDFLVWHKPYGYDSHHASSHDAAKKIYLSIHDPAQVPNLKSNGVQIEPGLWYEIVVYPSVTVTDETGLALHPERRNCLSKKENHDLKTFNIYSQSACIFECKQEQAIRKCNCSGWDYPRTYSSTKLCLSREETECFTAAMGADARMDECSCLNDCDYITYEYDVNVLTLDTELNSGIR